MSRIAIVSGWTNPGGSTVHFIELCNLLYDNGFDCTFYGPHSWHLDKCKADNTNNVNITKDDVLISHYISVKKTLAKYHILSCHETNMFALKDMDLKEFKFNFNSDWNSDNSFDISVLKDCHLDSIVICHNPKMQQKHKIKSVPTIIVFDEQQEVIRYEGNILMQLDISKKDIQKEIDSIYLTKFE